MQKKYASAGVRSPLTGKRANLLRRFSARQIRNNYRRALNIDIKRLLRKTGEIGLWQCQQSGFRFYHPSSLVGDGDFYQSLAKHPWYYQEKKWEFHEALKYIPRQGTLLEIGCGAGSFLSLCRQERPQLQNVGLDLSDHALQEARRQGFQVLQETAENHCSKHPAFYDRICAFQVLEHTSEPLPFLKACLNMLRAEGLLILAVPNNDPLSLFVQTEDPLNMPPHHQGLWDIPSLTYLGKILPLELKHLVRQPAVHEDQTNHYSRWIRADFKKRFGKVPGRMLHFLGKRYLDWSLQSLGPFLPGHSLFAVFQKVS